MNRFLGFFIVSIEHYNPLNSSKGWFFFMVEVHWRTKKCVFPALSDFGPLWTPSPLKYCARPWLELIYIYIPRPSLNFHILLLCSYLCSHLFIIYLNVTIIWLTINVGLYILTVLTMNGLIFIFFKQIHQCGDSHRPTIHFLILSLHLSVLY